ncbi:MAG: hypothetical protein IJ201_00245 [Solobacterium sp.]|nr:hypothetical protein [Solobacterium sp.]
MKEYICRDLLDRQGNIVGREYKGELIRCKDCKYYEVAELNYDGTPDKRCKPSVCTNGKYAVERPEDWYCGDAEPKEADG